METVESLLSERGRYAKQGRKYEQSVAKQSRLSDRVTELMSRPRALTDEVGRRSDAADVRHQCLLAEAAALRRRIRDAEEARERAEILAERLAANSRADAEGRRVSEANRAAARLEVESRRTEELQEASRRAVTNYVRRSRMGPG